MEIFCFARFHARPGMQEKVRQAMFDVQGPTRMEEGCLDYGGFHSVRDPDEFYIYSRWIDMHAFAEHSALAHTVRFIEAMEPLLDHPFKVTLAEKLW